MVDCSNCFQCCGDHIPVLIDEIKQIKKTHPTEWHNPPLGKGKEYCRFLTKDGKCSIYESRPGICKYYGNTSNQGMQCHRQTGKEEWSMEFQIRAKRWGRGGSLYL